MQILPTTSKKIKSFIKNYVELNILQIIVITYTNSLCKKIIIFINENESMEQPRQSHSTHTCYQCDILNHAGDSQVNAAGYSQPEHFSVKLLDGTPSDKLITFLIYLLQFDPFQ